MTNRSINKDTILDSLEKPASGMNTIPTNPRRRAMTNSIIDKDTILDLLENFELKIPSATNIFEVEYDKPENYLGSLLEALFDRQDGKILPEQWQLMRKMAAAQIDAKTAEVVWTLGPNLGKGKNAWPERQFFVRSPGSNELIPFQELLECTQQALVDRSLRLED
jgi:hypothetical protein